MCKDVIKKGDLVYVRWNPEYSPTFDFVMGKIATIAGEYALRETIGDEKMYCYMLDVSKEIYGENVPVLVTREDIVKINPPDNEIVMLEEDDLKVKMTLLIA